MKSIYRKLKDYIQKSENETTVIFGNLMSRDCCYCFEDEKENGVNGLVLASTNMKWIPY